MSTLLVLGSKPDPALPPASAYDAVACANASGFSAARRGLPAPVYTVMTAVLASGKEGDDHSLRALAGLSTGTVYFLPRPVRRESLPRRALFHLKTWRMKPFNLKRRLRGLSYRYDAFVTWPASTYHDLVRSLCDDDATIAALIERKQPSTGIFALALGVADRAYDRFILSGFDFRITHAYGDNPLIRERGTVESKHTDTDVSIIRYLSAKYGNICTTEPAMHERTGVPLLVDR